MNRSTAEDESRFPYWVALGSLAFVLWLFFGNTVPALRERQQLRHYSDELACKRAEFDAAIQAARLGLGPNAHYDLQALLVAIDQLGFTPYELCAAYPEPRPLSPGGAPVADEPDLPPVVSPEPGR